ncbi:MAG: carboxypeptidase-like regulatory domain-containing protein [Anaerolineales bacterium]|nr:carboxypeptidase-like regulatory domain-containing protein [Anaerolineales bacterium]
MKTHKKRGMVILILLTIFLLILLTACNLPSAATPTLSADAVATVVVGTMQSLTPSASPTVILTLAASPTLSSTPTLAEAQISGKVCYPGGINTDLKAYFQNTTTNQAVELSIAAGAAQYSVELTPATYIAYAWVTDFSIGGSYSACGQTPGCGDATPKPFSVASGQKVTGIDLCDWLHGPFDVPYPPGFQPTARLGIVAGSISGYLYGSLPQLAVVAFSQDTPYWYWAGTVAGQVYYTITDLPPGDYLIVAYDNAGHAGGSPTIVTVIAGQTTTVDITDWASSWPANPLK